MVRWLKSRSDSATAGRGQAVERRLSLKPACDGGGCDVAVTPDGPDGTYLPEGYASLGGRKRIEPYTFTWKKATKTYENVAPSTLSSCTNAEGKVIPDAYEFTSTTSLRFTPQEDGRPAVLRGTYTEKSKGVGAGVQAKCTDYESVWNVAAAPTQTTTDDKTDLAGTYLVTEIVETVVPTGSRVPGFAGILLPSSKVEKTATGYTVSGAGSKPAALASGSTGWSGKVSSPTSCTPGQSDIPDAYTLAESWSKLRPVVSTENGKPVISGRWQADWTPTAAGTSAGCTALKNHGYVIFVPQASL